jgi:hypothetical protein
VIAPLAIIGVALGWAFLVFTAFFPVAMVGFAATSSASAAG